MRVQTQLSGISSPVKTRHRWDFNGTAIAPEIERIKEYAAKLIEKYQHCAPGSDCASEYLLSLANDCRALINNMVVAPEYEVEFFSSTSRAVEVAISRAGSPRRIILSPFEHPSALKVARWYGVVTGAEIHEIEFTPEDYSASWEEQEHKLSREILRLVSGDKQPAVLILSQVCYFTGLVIPLDDIISRIQRGLDGSTLRIIVDGAHAIGNGYHFTPSLLCDSYVFSAHKWLLAPEPCGVILSRDHGNGVVPYDAWNNELPCTTANANMIAGLLSSLTLLNELGFESLWAYSRELRSVFTRRVAEKFTFVGENSGLDATLMLSLRPNRGRRWKYDARELREYFKTKGVHVLVMSIDPSTPWVRVTFRCFTEFQDIDRLCRALEEAIVERSL